MNRMRNPVPGAPFLSNVQCPIYQPLFPLSTDNTITVVTTAICSNGEPIISQICNFLDKFSLYRAETFNIS